MLVAVASRKGSPGVTTLAALIGAYWHQPGATRLVLEADPSGGSLAARWSVAHGLTWDPGLLALSTSRRAMSLDLLPAVAQPVADDLWVAAAPPGPDQVEAGLLRLGDAGAAGLAAAHGLVTIADCGRLRPTLASMVLARRAALTVLVCRPRLDEVHALVPAVAELRASGCTLGLACIGHRPYEPDDVATSLGVELLGVVPDDERAAEALDLDGLAAGRTLRRSRLVAEVSELVSRIQARCVELVGPLVPAGPAAGPAVHPGAPSPASGTVGTADPPSGSGSGSADAGVDGTSGARRPDGAAGDDGDEGDEQAVRRARLVAAGMDGPLSPAMMAARASAAAQVSPADRDDDE
ncbi:MAG: hypothetical protein AAF962_09385 [Actinomycetota bacterium]